MWSFVRAESYKGVFGHECGALCVQKVIRQCIWTCMWSFVCAESYKGVFGHECGALCVQKVIRQCIWT